MRLVLAALLMGLSSSAFANDAELRQKIVGTWTLVSVVYEDQATKALTPIMGERPRGYQIATPDGRIWFAGPGRSYVISATPKFDILAANDLNDGENFTTPAFAAGRIYIKGRSYLWCIGSKK